MSTNDNLGSIKSPADSAEMRQIVLVGWMLYIGMHNGSNCASVSCLTISSPISQNYPNTVHLLYITFCSQIRLCIHGQLIASHNMQMWYACFWHQRPQILHWFKTGVAHLWNMNIVEVLLKINEIKRFEYIPLGNVKFLDRETDYWSSLTMQQQWKQNVQVRLRNNNVKFEFFRNFFLA